MSIRVDRTVELRLMLFYDIGVYGPILLHRATRFKFFRYVFLVLKQFGTGVIISTAFVHVSKLGSWIYIRNSLSFLT